MSAPTDTSSPAAFGAAEAGAKHSHDVHQLQRDLAGAKMIEGEVGGGSAAVGEEEEQYRDARSGEEQEGQQEEEGYYNEQEEEEEEEEDAHTPVGIGAGGIISPHHGGRRDHAGDPSLANVLADVCDVCEQEVCACDLVARRRGLIVDGTPQETKRGGKPHLPRHGSGASGPKRAVTPTSWRPQNKNDYRSHHRPPHRDPHHALVASRDADFVGDVPHGAGGGAGGSGGGSATRSGKKRGEEEEEQPAATAPSAPLSAIDAEVQPPVVPPPGLKGRPSYTGGARIPALELPRDPFTRAGAPASAAGAGGRGHVAGHKHRGQMHSEFTSLG
jgi:hypothetical protein